MDTEVYTQIQKAVSEGTWRLWLLVFSSLLLNTLGVFLFAFLKKRAENAAVNQNFENVIAQLELKLKLTEQIQSDSAQTKSYNQTLGQQRAIADNLEAVLAQLRAQTNLAEEIKSEFAKQTQITTEELKAEFARQTVMANQKQTRWAPLLEAVREFKEKLDSLAREYQYPPKRAWTKLPELPSVAGDFCELLTLAEDPDPIDNWYDPKFDPAALRKDNVAVQRLRTRMLFELTNAEDSLYRTAKYLGYAERVRKDLHNGLLIISSEERQNIIDLLTKVREELHGTSVQHPAAGIFFQRQESIGESVWDDHHDRVISDFEFREKLLLTPGWEEFKSLFRFFVEFHLKVGTEVKQTREALEQLYRRVEKLCFLERMDETPVAGQPEAMGTSPWSSKSDQGLQPTA